MKHLVALAVVAAGLALAATASAQTIYRRQPANGMLRAGEKVLVDNGRCPKGQILEVTAGTMPDRTARHGQATFREKHCIPRS